MLTGGCFQNALLAEGVLARLSRDFDVRLHGDVPPGDGGIALGQALVADASDSGMTLLVGRIDRLYEGAGGRWAIVSVRGARVEVAARPGAGGGSG